MFTGLVEEVGTLERRDSAGPSARLAVRTRLGEHEPLVLGESIAVNGVCLTVTRITGAGFEADSSSETLAKTTLGSLRVPCAVHLERASKLGARMGGHVVLGHVDDVGRVVDIVAAGDARAVTLEIDRALAPLVAPKGSVAIDGASLTVNRVDDQPASVRFTVMLVPHTLGATRFPDLRAGDRVNIEADVLARYVQRQLGFASAAPAADRATAHAASDASLLESLRKNGWM
jgi:riboflavin synthase